MGIEETFAGTIYETDKMKEKNDVRSTLCRQLLSIFNGHQVDDIMDALERVRCRINGMSTFTYAEPTPIKKVDLCSTTAGRIAKGFNLNS